MIIDYNSWPYFNCYEFCFQYRIETIYAYFSLPPDWSIVFWEYRQVNVLNITGKQAPVFHAPWPAGRQLGWRRPTDSCYSYYMYQVNTMLHLVIWLFHFSFSWSRVGSIQLSSHHLTSSNQILVNWHHCYHDHVHHHWSLYSETSKSSLLLLRFSSLIWYHVVFNFWSWTGAMCSSISMFVSRTVLSHFKLGPPTVVMQALNISEEEVLGVGRPRQQIIISCRLTNDRSMIESLRLLTID